jgi:hypothetical protein
LLLIYALQQASWLKKRKVIFNVKNNDTTDRVQQVLNEIGVVWRNSNHEALS